MSRSFPKAAAAGRAAFHHQWGMSVLEILVSLTIMAVVFGSIHLAVGNAISAKLMVSNRVAGQNQGRLVVEWIADRVRQAGLGATPGSSLARCRNGIVSQDALYYPTTSSLSITADVDNDGTPETRTFKVETVSGVATVTESVAPCIPAAQTSDQPLTDSASVQVSSLAFAYFDGNGNAVTNLTSPAAIQAIRSVQVTVRVHAILGQAGPADQVWSTNVVLRNP